ncbi:MAG: PilZ domain-containing protein [Gammaproteobacteria bacterium]|nr:PilZ domain-containing protein [Gammaproteobacteria bacterium]
MGAANYIENRWSQRRPLSMQVEVLSGGVKLAQGQARDVGLGGVFLFLDLEQQPSGEIDVELLFDTGSNGESRHKHKLRARIVRHSAEGIGLMFRDFDTSSFRALQEVMRYTDVSN